MGGIAMRNIFYVDREMCGGESLPADFDLEEFCEILQGKLSDVEVLPVVDLADRAFNRCPDLVSESVFFEALGEYYHR
jgi:hypothetical protein